MEKRGCALDEWRLDLLDSTAIFVGSSTCGYFRPQERYNLATNSAAADRATGHRN